MLDLIIKNGKVVEHDGIYDVDLHIKDGKIVATAENSDGVEAVKTIDAKGRYVLPGAIDSHSHIGQLPGPQMAQLQTFEENFATESMSALHGGITTALNYIFSQDSMVEMHKKHRAVADEHSNINIKFHGALLNQSHVDELEQSVASGLNSFKIFLPYKGEEGLRLGGLSSLNDGQLYDAMLRMKEVGALPIVHSENPELIDFYVERFNEYDRQDMRAWEETHPTICEGEAVNKVIYLSEKTGCDVAIAHVSSGYAVELIERTNGRVLLETCPHYLALTADAKLDALGKVGPPVRYQPDQDKLWEYLLSDRPAMMGSDHNAWSRVHKFDMWQGLAGLYGNSFILPMIISEGVMKRGMSWQRAVEITSYTAAKRVGIYPEKGTLRAGSDADLVIIDTEFNKEMPASETPSIVDYSPYDGYVFPAWPTTVVCSGKLRILDGTIL